MLPLEGFTAPTSPFPGNCVKLALTSVVCSGLPSKDKPDKNSYEVFKKSIFLFNPEYLVLLTGDFLNTF